MDYIVMFRINDSHFYHSTFERVIYRNVDGKNEVKKKLIEDYPEFFPSGKVFQKRKDGELVYCLIYELDEYWDKYWNQVIECPNCGAKTTKIQKANMDGWHLDFCSEKCKKEYERTHEFHNEKIYECDIYIYKITQKSTGKCYVGKTTNHFIWRWWQHLKANTGTKFHEAIKDIRTDDLMFEVLEILPKDTDNKAVLLKESEYIKKYNSIDNGFNTTISNKDVYEEDLLKLDLEFKGE